MKQTKIEYAIERSEGVPCMVASCPWHNSKYEQNCQAESNGEPHVADCVDYAIREEPRAQIPAGTVINKGD